MIAWSFDALLAAGLLWLAWRSLASTGAFEAVILFVVFGLFMALCWARLAAPDVALAEAAIGAGLTGALLLDACRALPADAPEPGRMGGLGRLMSASLAVLAAALFAGLAWALCSQPTGGAELAALVRERLPESGVTNPVTAVLLNFRAYDTWLEVAVLLLALLGVWAVNAGGGAAASRELPALPGESALVDTLVGLLAPPAVLVAGYLLWAGAHAPGGAFQAGAVLTGLGVLLCLSGRLRPVPVATTPVRAVAVLGLSVFGGVALVTALLQGSLLSYPSGWAGTLILGIETALTLSIALTLTLLFSAGPGLGRGEP